MPNHHFKFILFSRILATVIFFLFVGCGTSEKPNGGTSTLTLNWFPEVEHGGYFEAFSIQKPELGVTVEAGGPDIPVIQKVALGQSTFGICNADDVVNAQAQGADIVAIFAPLHNNPRCIMLRPELKIESMEQVENITLALSSRPAFSHWLRHRYPFKNVNIVPYPGSIATFMQNKNFAQQAYSISEPFLARQAGIQPKLIMVSELGFNPYCSVLITQRKNLNSNKVYLKKIVMAAKMGWLNYLENNTKTHQLIHQLNPTMGLDILNFGHAEIHKLAQGPQSLTYGKMESERWNVLIQQMIDCQLIKKDAVQASQCFSNEFLD
jgi:NitT/TauT family transport system substrate-binding protein